MQNVIGKKYPTVEHVLVDSSHVLLNDCFLIYNNDHFQVPIDQIIHSERFLIHLGLLYHQLLVLCSDDVKYLSVIENMFVNLKLSNGEAPEEQFVHIPISIQSETMYKIIDWSRAAKKTDESKLDFCQFFPNINIKEAIQILEASLFLGLIKLEKCAAKWIASKLEGKSTSEMAQILVVPNAGLNEESQEQLNQFKLVTPPYLD
ncbi:hypothetical protein CRE_01904 [Caenorhabditis remanei]|uniref:BTB domain-containing protein n=1 Tax=Caenorhabditis remanei TaxID=31234 RepID=E3LG73_CAERE|nr:hypothetical protein CRE_01904 [Caenorhabditis remanei]